MRILLWMYNNNKVRNENNGSDAGKVTERQLNWHGHVMKRDEERILRKVLPGKRKTG